MGADFFPDGLGYSPEQRRAGFSDAEVSAPDARAYFLFDGKKKVAKEKATPGYAVGCADFPALLDGSGGCGTRGYAPQTVLADSPRPASVARRSTWGPEKHRGAQAKVKTKTFSAAFGVPCPLRGAEQRRAFGGCRLALFEPKASLASRPNARVAQGTGAAGCRPRVAFFFGYFLLGETRRKYARASGAEPSGSIYAHRSAMEPRASEKAPGTSDKPPTGQRLNPPLQSSKSA